MLNKPRTSPEKYIGLGGDKTKKLSFRNQYALPASSQETPWVTSRFTPEDLTKSIANRRLNFNDLNFVSEDGFNQAYEMFPGRGRFDSYTDYDYELGRPATPNFPEEQPDFNPLWNELYISSPIIPPSDKSKNPFPRAQNPDPNGYLQQMMEEGLTSLISPFPELINENPQASTSI